MKINLGQIITWLPIIISYLIFGLTLCNYFFGQQLDLGRLKVRLFSLKSLIIAWLAFMVLYSLCLSGLQYLTWRHNLLGQYFLPPYQPLRYFINYAWYHFWLSNFIVFSVTVLLIGVLKLFGKYRRNLLKPTEAGLFFLGAMLVGWPNFVLFVPLVFIISVFLSLYFQILKNRKESSLELPILIAILVIFIVGNSLIKMLGLSVLKL